MLPTVCPMWPQCCPNVAPMLPQGCPNVATLLPQCGPNVAPMLPQCGPNVAPMLAQCDPTLRARISTALIISFFSGAFFGVLLKKTWPARVERRSSSSIFPVAECCPMWILRGTSVALMCLQVCAPMMATLLLRLRARISTASIMPFF